MTKSNSQLTFFFSIMGFRLGTELEIPKISKEHAESTINYLMAVAQHTAVCLSSLLG